MSKIKKILAVVLAMAMVMAMGVVSLADGDSATITVENADGATLKYVQVIEPDQKTATGWKFSSDEIESIFLTVYGGTDAQTVLQTIIKENGNASDAFISAINSVITSGSVTLETMANPQEVKKAGVYAIKASEEGYTYSPMAAYVSFGEVKDSEGNTVYPALISTSVSAKKRDVTPEKTTTDKDLVTEIGKIVEYTVETTMPYGVSEWKVIDEIIGASYVKGENGKVEVTLKIDGTEATVEGEVTEGNGGESFTVDLTKYLNNKISGTPVILTYQAVVTGTEVSNSVKWNNGENDSRTSTVDLYTGEITLTKTAEDGETGLEGAGFKVCRVEGQSNYKEISAEGTLALTFSKVLDADGNVVPGAYVYDPDGSVTELFTNSAGKLMVSGLDVGEYGFGETTAPKGYSINEEVAVAELKVTTDDGKATETIKAETSMKDTKLSSLPSTGGIGTTIFTIVGCLIMIGAAAIFFISRRKAEK